jgi:hypothetical protein
LIELATYDLVGRVQCMLPRHPIVDLLLGLGCIGEPTGSVEDMTVSWRVTERSIKEIQFILSASGGQLK